MTHIQIDPDKLRRARHRAGYSLRELAGVLGVDHNVLWLYEAGRRNPRPRTVRELAQTLGVEVKDLLRSNDG
jgi:transcriptional regulator with XRE-family HTH domain